jgi:hypothetical protein
VAEQLKVIVDSHAKAVIQTKQRLNLRDTVGRVLSAIWNRNTNLVTGNDMARLIEELQSEDIFANKLSVKNAI